MRPAEPRKMAAMRRLLQTRPPPPAAAPLDALLTRAGDGEEGARRYPLLAAWSRLADEAALILRRPLDRLFPERRWVLVDAAGGFDVHQVRGRRVEALGRIADDGADAHSSWLAAIRSADRVEGRIDPAQIVAQEMRLPAESAPFAEAVVRHRLDRLTPWRVEDVVYGTRLVADGQDGTVRVDVSATSREIALGVLRRLERLRIRPHALGSAAEPLAQALRVNLLSGATIATRRQRRLRGLCMAALPLSLLAFLASVAMQSRAQDALDASRAALGSQRQALLAQVPGEDGGAVAAVLAAKTPDQATVVLLDRLASALPDDTSLAELEITPDRVQIKGQSANAPALVPRLEGQAGLRDVRFQSAVIREAQGGDRFDITAERAGIAAAAAAEAAP